MAGLIQWRKLGLSDSEILGHHPDLNQDDLDVAWDYYETHAAEIEKAIEDDEAA